MVKLITILLLMIGATNLVAAPTQCVQEMNCMELTLGGNVSEEVAVALFEQAAVIWQETEQKLMLEFRANQITIQKIGVSNGDPVYQVDRAKTGGSLVLILDVEAA